MKAASKPGAIVLLARVQRDYEEARERRDYTIRACAREGMSTREIGAAIGLSHARVAEIIRESAR